MLERQTLAFIESQNLVMSLDNYAKTEEDTCSYVVKEQRIFHFGAQTNQTFLDHSCATACNICQSLIDNVVFLTILVGLNKQIEKD